MAEPSPSAFDWPVILAWAEATGASSSEVKAKFGCPEGSFRRQRWTVRRREQGIEAGERSPGRSKDGKKRRRSGKAEPPPPAPEGKAPPPSMRAEDLGVQDRQQLRAAIRIELERLSNPDTGAWERQAAATTLRILLAACPDVLTFDERTRGGTSDVAGPGPGAGEDVEARLRDALAGAAGPQDEG